MLEGTLYQVAERQEREALVRLLRESPVYAAHFPGYPVTPGVTLVQMALELMDRRLTGVKNIKFLVPVQPSDTEPTLLRYRWRFPAAGKAEVEVLLPDDTLCARMSLEITADTVVLIPTYNNAGTVVEVVQRALGQGLPVLVVDDGCTDATPDLLAGIDGITLIRHPRNRGKGHALRTGFEKARELGYRQVLTLDADGQHFPEDIPVLLAQKGDRNLVVGSRNIQAEGMASSSTFANRFSNGTFRLLTTLRLTDTQTGYRLYPLAALPPLAVLSARYEAEVILLVFSAWKGLRLVPVPVRVAYPEDRVTHFRPGADFVRIFITYTVLFLFAVFYGYPRTFFRKLRSK